ncbi:calumenin-like [Impatiens glandulifera]|uniref:calumenin-like n=1 Tax=Impatiens glandulifera TaxID=253017 RepID=UPI001FB0D978|nr:calumenin-like [Impatiens glandulifera]
MMGGKEGSVIAYIALAIFILFLISYTPSRPSSSRHRRLKLRSNFSFSPAAAGENHHQHTHRDRQRVPFDPLVADIEMKREDREWEKMHFEHSHPEFATHEAPGAESQPEFEDFMNAEDYINDEDRFNVTGRLILLFPKLDVDPPDGFATQHELTEWMLKSSEKEVLHRTQRELELHDKNHDGLVSFAEYEPPTWVRNSDNNSTYGYDMGWWKEEHFNASDSDGDGFLNITEYNDFLHPADSNNPKLLHWLCKEEIRERDSDKDGKVNFKEFFGGLFDMVRNYDEELIDQQESEDAREAPARKLFAQLDKDADRYLSDTELVPVIGKLHPSERYYAKQQADYILSQADSDKDGKLSLTEMIDNPYVFYSAIFSEEEEDDFENHDEFR